MSNHQEKFVVNRPTNWTNDRMHFFKYMSRNTARAVLVNGTLRWSTPGTLNDPYDMQFDLHIDIDVEALKPIVLDKLWEAHYGDESAIPKNHFGEFIKIIRSSFPKLDRKEFDEIFGSGIEESIDRIKRSLPLVQEQVGQAIAAGKILCLTERPDNRAMWTYYGEEHQGVVLRFRSIPELDSAWGVAEPINYLPDMPHLINNDFIVGLVFEGVSHISRMIMKRLVYTKSHAYQHEHEWRLFAGTGRDIQSIYEDIKFHPLELDGIIFGCRMPDEDRSEFAKIIRSSYPHAAILQALKASRNFAMEIQPLA